MRRKYIIILMSLISIILFLITLNYIEKRETIIRYDLLERIAILVAISVLLLIIEKVKKKK